MVKRCTDGPGQRARMDRDRRNRLSAASGSTVFRSDRQPDFLRVFSRAVLVAGQRAPGRRSGGAQIADRSAGHGPAGMVGVGMERTPDGADETVVCGFPQVQCPGCGRSGRAVRIVATEWLGACAGHGLALDHPGAESETRPGEPAAIGARIPGSFGGIDAAKKPGNGRAASDYSPVGFGFSAVARPTGALPWPVIRGSAGPAPGVVQLLAFEPGRPTPICTVKGAVVGTATKTGR